ncbi:MAG: hypothetical protein QXF51_06195 [Nitrososphaerota archaeon]
MGFAEAELEGVRGIIHITIGSEEEPPLIGYTAFEIFELKPNPATRRLEPSNIKTDRC